MATSDSIDDVMKTQFGHTVYELTEQTKARTRGLVSMEPIAAKDLMIDRIGTVEVQELVDRYPDIVPQDIEWDRRRLRAARIGVALPIDKFDAQRILMDPQSLLAKKAAEALERHFDRVVLRAALDTVYVGEHGTDPVSAASDGVVQVDAQTGLTYEKLLEISETFQSKEVGTEIPVRKVLFITEQEHTQLMKETELTSGDFSRRYVIDEGYITRALDMEIMVYGSDVANPQLKVTNGVRSCMAVAFEAIKVGLQQSWEIEVREANQKWHTKLVLASGIIGGTRLEGKRIIEVQTTAA